MTKFATVCPAVKFTLDVDGAEPPVGNTLKKPAPDGPVTVTFTTTAPAAAGTTEVGKLTANGTPPAKLCPVHASLIPLTDAARVSHTLVGVTPENTSPPFDAPTPTGLAVAPTGAATAIIRPATNTITANTDHRDPAVELVTAAHPRHARSGLEAQREPKPTTALATTASPIPFVRITRSVARPSPILPSYPGSPA